MIRTKLLALAVLVAPLVLTTGRAQEIRLEPPQLDRNELVENSKPVGSRSPQIRTRSPKTKSGPVRMAVARVNPKQETRSQPRTNSLRANSNSLRSQSNATDRRAVTRVKFDNTRYLGNAPAVEKRVVVQQQEEIIGEEIIEGDLVDGQLIEDGVDCGGCGACEDCGFYCPPYQLISFVDMEYSFGVQAFDGVPNLGESGSFGFNESINWGFPFPAFPLLSLSGQLGVRFAQSDLNGGSFTGDVRDQLFLTGGISRRVDYGLQMGVAVDYLNDNWYMDGAFAQLRSEMSLVGGFGNQLGFRVTANLDDDTEDVQAGLDAIGFTAISNFEPVDNYRIFYRHAWDQERGGHAEMMAGFTEDGDGIFGADFLIPVAERWALNSSFTCLMPSDSSSATSQIDESWNVGMGLTWYPKGLTTWSKLYHRPLFNVADNGTFMFQQ
ncbi:MAG: DUF6666 family protein [Planctomycetota bacterium]|nr:DUF6666 family protein [Planctomycetota bacterium]